ncbi:MAG: isoaspartyl peptidase/L-asparaginase family protein [candidate division WOR-3 bacterium]|jgi:beta-aspartyl-peptidase (threonine type)
MDNRTVTIICHGGAGTITNKEAYATGLAEAIEEGYRLLRQGAGAIEAVLRAVVILEDNPVFNAGTGSSLTIDGIAEMDAGIMTQNGRFGGVCCIRNVKNPILVAERVMTETDHLILCGEGAVAFARRMGFPEYNPVTDQAQARLNQVKAQGSRYFPRLNRQLGIPEEKLGTVGAVAFDRNGHIAAATSSGGIVGRLSGRVGDSGILGAGVYAGTYGGVSCTGHGEAILRMLLARDIFERMRTLPAGTAVTLAMAEAKQRKILCGAICIDARGTVGFGHTAPEMAYGYKAADRLFLWTDSIKQQ